MESSWLLNLIKFVIFLVSLVNEKIGGILSQNSHYLRAGCYSTHIITLSLKNRRTNVVIYGMREKPEEVLEQLVEDILAAEIGEKPLIQNCSSGLVL